jgi:hypothetical protein
MLRASFGVFSGHVVALCGIAVLTIFASGAATAGIQAALGPAGTGLVILVFVILGNAASGGPLARPLLPGLWRTIGGVLRPGARRVSVYLECQLARLREEARGRPSDDTRPGLKRRFSSSSRCAQRVLVSFLSTPSARNTSCVAALRPPNFR